MPLGPEHPRGCHCPKCDRTERAAAEAKRLQDEAAREAGARLVRATEARKVAKLEAGREEISREVREANRAAAEIRAASAAAADPKVQRLVELRAQGKTLAEAFGIIEGEEHADGTS